MNAEYIYDIFETTEKNGDPDLIIGLAGFLPWLILLALVLTAVILLARRHGGRPSLGGQRGFGRRGRKKKEVPPAEKSDTK